MASFDDPVNEPGVGGRAHGRATARGRGNASLFSILWRRAWIVLVTAVLVAAAATAVAYLTRNTYQSTAELLFDQTIGPQLNALGLNPPFNNADRLAGDNIAIVQSQAVAALTAQRLGSGATARTVQHDITILGSKTSDVVNITASSKSATGAARLAGLYARSAVDLVQGPQTGRARSVLTDLHAQYAALTSRQRNAPAGQQLLNRITTLHAIATTGTGDPQLIQPAFVPTQKGGSLVQTLALATLFGLVLGVALALLRERTDRKLRDVEDVSSAFEAPILATIPRNRGLARHAAFADLPAQASEAFFMLQANLRYGRQQGAPRSMIITSARDRQGKTTVAYNLACATAAAGFSVALVDADLRRSKLAVVYGLRSFPGLTEVLRGDVSMTSAIQRVSLLANGAENGSSAAMSVLVAGSTPPNASVLIQSDGMSEVLSQLVRSHDVVIVDTPPIAQVADAIPLLRRTEGVLVVASLHSTKGLEAEQLREQLQALDAPLLGVVANGTSSADGYSPYYRSKTVYAP